MNTNKFDIQNALADIAMIRRTLNLADQDQMDTRLVGVTLDANLILQTLALITASALLLVEIFSGSILMQTLMSAGNIDELRHVGIGLIGFTLAGLLITLYFVLWRAAMHNGESIQSYITRNFKYVKNLSLISDLLMKFGTLSLLLLASKAEWIAPILIAFTADYLLQGRFFTLPTKISAILGIACLGAAILQFTSNTYSLIWPLGIFSLIVGISVVRLALRYKQQSESV
jgi:hypothetical protein